MTMSEARKRELMGLSKLGRKVSGQPEPEPKPDPIEIEAEFNYSRQPDPVTFELPAQPPTTSKPDFSLSKEFRELHAKTQELAADIEKFQQERYDSKLAAQAHDIDYVLGLSDLGAGIIRDRQAEEAAKQAAFEANQEKPIDRYLALTPLGASILRERKSGGKI